MRTLSLLAPALLAALPAALRAQSIADRVAGTRDGEVRLSYAARPGACGDGRDVVALGRNLYVYDSMESYGRWSGVSCVPGPVRVTLTVHGGVVTGARVRVGAPPVGAVAGGTELGTVPAPAAAEYFLGLAKRADGAAAKEAVLAAALADSADVAPGLLTVARDDSRPRAARRRAVHWAGALGGAAVVPELDAIARDASAGREIREPALAALSGVEANAGVPALLRHARADADPWLQKKAVFWLGRTDAPEARHALRAIVDSTGAPDELRAAAVFSLGHGDDVSADDVKFLQAAYGRVESARIKDQILMAVTQQDRGGAGARWALDRARDPREPLAARKKAAFWAGQGDAPVKDLASLYDGVTEPELREHLLFVLSQRDERAATDQLLAVAKGDPDPRMRRKALFWLGQKDDPRVATMIRDIVTH
jgi:HEAT repeat protein